MFSSPESEMNAKKSHLLMLIHMAKADNDQPHELEDRFIIDIAAKMGFSRTDVDLIKANSDNIIYDIPISEKERMTYFYHLLFLMKIDGEVTDPEKKLCRELGFRLGFRPLLVEDMIRIMATYVKQRVPANEMLNAIKKYLN